MQGNALQALRLGMLTWALLSAVTPNSAQAAGPLFPEAVVHAATFRANALAPSQMLTIFLGGVGPSAAAAPGLDSSGRLPTNFNGVEARFDGQPASLLYVGPDQVTLLAPSRLAGRRSAHLTLVDFQQRVHDVTLPVAATAPGLFLHGNDPSLAVATDVFGRVITRENPAEPGQVLILYAAGDGARSPSTVDGVPATEPLPQPAAPISLTVADSAVELLYTGAAPGYVGLMQINARLPGDLPGGDLPVTLLAGAQASPQGAHLPVDSPRPYAPDGILIQPGENIQAIVDAAPGGSTFRLAAGVHRMQLITPRSFDRFVGEPGAILNGSRLLTSFQRQGSLWIAGGQTQRGTLDGECRDQSDGSPYSGCRYPEDLYIDDVPLRQVESLGQVVSGTWFFDYAADRVYLADDPSGHMVEIGVASHAFRSAGRDVQIRGLTIEKYANPSQVGAIHAADQRGRLATGWIVEDCVVRLNHGTGILVGDQMTVRRNRVLRNGQLGLGGGGTDSLVEDNEIAYNNYAEFSPSWEAGGTKFFLSRNLTVRGNFVHRNDGPGLWTDIDNVRTVYENNVITDNSQQGIQHEISFDAIIRNNTVERNGLAFDDWLWGAQILVQNSSNVEVYGNQVVVAAEGGDGIVLIQQDRGGSAMGPYVTRNNRVRDNEISYLGARGQGGAVADFDQEAMLVGGNSFNSNTYRVASPNRRYWVWGDALNWTAFQAAGQETNGQRATLP